MLSLIRITDCKTSPRRPALAQQSSFTTMRASGCAVVAAAAAAAAGAAAVAPFTSAQQAIDGVQRDSAFDDSWLFFRGDSSPGLCSFPIDLGDVQCMGLTPVPFATTPDACAQACCTRSTVCQTWQFCPTGTVCDQHGVGGCWVGAEADCHPSTDGWVSRGRDAGPDEPLPAFATSAFDDSSWRGVQTPHDWAIEDLPAREADVSTPVITVRNGTWRFAKGDNASWSKVNVDDQSAPWADIAVPSDWREPPTSYTDTNAVGWCVGQLTIESVRDETKSAHY